MMIDDWQEEQRRFLDHLWMRWKVKGYGRVIQDEASHERFVQAMRKKYVYPDYLDLVGPVQPDHHVPGYEPATKVRSGRGEMGCLTRFRQAELLLVGAHLWQNLWIGTHEAVFGYDPIWPRPRWTSDDRGWYVALDYRPPRRKGLAFEAFVTPFRSLKVMRLEQYLASKSRKLSSTEAVRVKNGNVYDCRPDNLESYSVIGRPMLCKGCGRTIGRDQSVRIKIGGTTQRYCYEYLALIERMGCTPHISRCLHRM